MKLRKNAQSETVGFVIIILLVMIIGVIFLGISLSKKPAISATDSEIANFLITSAKYTTDCAKDYEPNYLSLGDVIAGCYQNTACLDGRASCEVLNKTYGEMLINFRPSGRVLSYYKLTFHYALNITDIQDSTEFGSEVIYGNSSSCSLKRAGRNYISMSTGSIVEQLDICLAS